MIELTLVQGHGLVFSADDVATLREQHRIVGALAGCLAAHPHQNIHLGLPLQLSSEEVTLLLEKGFARFKLKNNKPGHFKKDELLSYKNFMQKSYEEQIELASKNRFQEIEDMADKIVKGKLATDRKNPKKGIKSGKSGKTDEGGVHRKVDISTRQKIISDVKKRVQPLTEEHMLVQTFDVNPFFETPSLLESENHPTEICKCGSSDVCRFSAVSWNYPQTTEDQTKYFTFKYFWERGHYLTNGAKFGGDFLAYPGDPLRYHSFYIVICLVYNQKMTTENLITFSRLGTAVKKTVVLCGVNDDGELVVTSLEWSHWN